METIEDEGIGKKGNLVNDSEFSSEDNDTDNDNDVNGDLSDPDRNQTNESVVETVIPVPPTTESTSASRYTAHSTTAEPSSCSFQDYIFCSENTQFSLFLLDLSLLSLLCICR